MNLYAGLWLVAVGALALSVVAVVWFRECFRSAEPSGVTSPVGLQMGGVAYPPLLAVNPAGIAYLSGEGVVRKVEQPIGGPMAVRVVPLEMADGTVLLPRATGLWRVAPGFGYVRPVATRRIRQLLGELTSMSVLAVAEDEVPRGSLGHHLVRVNTDTGAIERLAEHVTRGNLLTAGFDPKTRRIAIATIDRDTHVCSLHILDVDCRIVRSAVVPEVVSGAFLVFRRRKNGDELLFTWNKRSEHAPAGIGVWSQDGLREMSATLQAPQVSPDGVVFALHGDRECCRLDEKGGQAVLLRASNHAKLPCSVRMELQLSPNGQHLIAGLHDGGDQSPSRDSLFLIDLAASRFSRHVTTCDQVLFLQSAAWELTSRP